MKRAKRRLDPYISLLNKITAEYEDSLNRVIDLDEKSSDGAIYLACCDLVHCRDVMDALIGHREEIMKELADEEENES